MDINTNSVQMTDKEFQNKSSVTKQGETSFKEEFQNLEQQSTTQEETKSEEKTDNTASKELVETINQINKQNLHQTDDFSQNNLNKGEKQAVTQDIANKKDVFLMLNNDFNINRQQELQTELKADINFAQNNNEAFSSLLGNNSFSESAEELSEDESILSTTAENLAMINKATVGGIKEIGIIIDRTIDAKSLNLTREDVTFFINLVNDTSNMQDIVPKEDIKAAKISETLANMLAESMRNNKAFRLNFDNNISIIIKVSREGRISANFLPGNEIAENYLKNNLANLVQKFEEEGLPYDELTHQKHKRDNEQQNNRKDNNNE